MRPFSYVSVTDPNVAIRRAAEISGAEFIAGGTDMIQLLQEDVRTPPELIDINGLPFDTVASTIDSVRIGALCRLSDVADHPLVRERYRALAEALAETASPMVRNMATMAGNLLQRTRCPYFRDAATPCNKRQPGSGCSAREGQNRINAILGGSPHCIATYPSDLAIALVALDAELMIGGPSGERTIKVEQLHQLPGNTPHIETVLEPGDLIMAIVIPIEAGARRSHFLKVRDRASFEWAVASAAVALGLDGDTVLEARIAVGGVATKPWRLVQVEEKLVGRRLDRDLIHDAAERAADGAEPRGQNAFKVSLLKRTVERALTHAGGLDSGGLA
jgi:xanthine dehydrogenase YagS FAD-binding subunit